MMIQITVFRVTTPFIVERWDGQAYLFKDATCIVGYIALNDQMISRWYTGKDVEVGVRGLI